MYRLKSESGGIIADVPVFQYVDFNKTNQYPYITNNSGPAILVNNKIYLLSDPESIKKQKELGVYLKYQHCSLEEISSDISIFEMQNKTEETKKKVMDVENEVKALQKKTDDQNEQNLIIMTAIADLYEQISTLQGVNQNG